MDFRGRPTERCSSARRLAVCLTRACASRIRLSADVSAFVGLGRIVEGLRSDRVVESGGRVVGGFSRLAKSLENFGG